MVLAPQQVAVTGNVFALAQGQLQSAPLNFGTVQVGQVINHTLSIANIATGPAGFVEDLGVSFGAATGTGASRITGSGSIAALAAGATDASSLSVGVDTSTVGSVSAAIGLNYVSTGTVGGVSNGLGAVSIGSESFGITGTIEAIANVIAAANPVITTVQPIALGNVRQGAVVAPVAVAVTNQAVGGDQAALNGAIAGAGAVTASGSFAGLAPGASDATALSVGISTANAGAINGLATLSFVSDASNIGGCAPNCEMVLPDQQVAVTGAVYRVADPSLNTTAIDLVARRGETVSQTISVTNVSPDAFTEALDATLGATPAGFVAAGSLTGLGAGQTDATSLSVALNTSSAGSFAGSVDVAFTSSGVGTTGAADLALGSGSVSLNGRVYEAAAASVGATVIDFGILRVGDVVGSQAIAITNSAALSGLNDTLAASLVLPAGPFTAATGSVAGIAAQTSGNLAVGLDTSMAGVFNLGGQITLASQNPDMIDLLLAPQALTLQAQVNNLVNPVFSFLGGAGTLSGGGNAFTLDFGTVSLGTSLSTSVSLLNDVSGPSDLLFGDFDLSGISAFDLTGFGSLANLAGGAGSGALSIGLNAPIQGFFSQTLTFDGFGRNASGPDLGFGPVSLTLTANVLNTPAPIPLPAPILLLLSGLGGLGALRVLRRRKAA